MPKICTCEGLNPNCEKCFGSGYIDEAEPKKSGKAAQTHEKPKVATVKKARHQSILPEDIKAATRNELESISLKIIAELDSKSKKQMQVLNSIPFSTTTFRRDFKDKFENLRMLENDKVFLRSELTKLVQETAEKKYFNRLTYGHFLSDKEIDVSSNRQLKELIRAYKKLKP